MIFWRNLIAASVFFAVLALTVVTAPDARSTAAIIRDVFGPRAQVALRVARCESNLHPRALGSAGERGIFQIHPVHFGWLNERRLYEPLYNSRIAFRLSRGGRDWSAWSCA